MCVKINRSELIEWELGTATGKKESRIMQTRAAMFQEGPWRWKVNKETPRDSRRIQYRALAATVLFAGDISRLYSSTEE